MYKKFIGIVCVSCIVSVRSFTSTICTIHDNKLAQTATTIAWGSKWDSLIDEDENELQFNASAFGPPVPRDMRYNLFNLERQRKNYESMRAVAGKDILNDVYARDPESDTFWFVGKVARVSDVSIEKAMARQWSMIEEHSARLRPQELYPKWGSLELWVAPGDSEMDVAYNRAHIQFIQMFRDVDEDIVSSVRNVEVGFAGELYENGEEGFRTTRTADGKPAKSEVLAPNEMKQPTEADIDQMAELLSNQTPEGIKSRVQNIQDNRELTESEMEVIDMLSKQVSQDN